MTGEEFLTAAGPLRAEKRRLEFSIAQARMWSETREPLLRELLNAHEKIERAEASLIAGFLQG